MEQTSPHKDERYGDPQSHQESPPNIPIFDPNSGYDLVKIVSPSECDLAEISNFDVTFDGKSAPAIEVPTSTIDGEQIGMNILGDSDGRRCQICNDVASGFHYGVWSCEGCKAFYKRSLQGPVDYVCPATNTCTIDKQRRKACQACRLRKCIEMGMTRGNCRPEKHHADDAGDSMPKKKRASAPSKSRKEQEPGAPATSLPPLVQDSPKSSEPHPLVERLLHIDTPVLMADHDSSLPETEATLMGSILRLGGKELFDIINWARSVPGYLDLPLQDRIHLLESCWMEVLICGLCWRSAPFSAQEVLVFAPDLIMDKARCERANMTAEGNKLMAVVQNFAENQLSREEFVLLKATVLMNAEVISSDSEVVLRRNREQLMQAWYAQCDPRRVCQLLLLLPHLRQISLHGLAKMFELRAEQMVSFSDLMGELLESRFSSGRVSSSKSQCSYPNSHAASQAGDSPANVDEASAFEVGGLLKGVAESGNKDSGALQRNDGSQLP